MLLVLARALLLVRVSAGTELDAALMLGLAKPIALQLSGSECAEVVGEKLAVLVLPGDEKFCVAMLPLVC